MSDQLQNLWIPDEEVERKDKKLRGNSEDRGLDHSVHGATLSTGLRNIVSAYSLKKKDLRSMLCRISIVQLSQQIRRCSTACRNGSANTAIPEV